MATMLVCPPCGRFYKTKRNGVSVEEGMPLGRRAPDGTYPEGWQGYKLWSADLFECEGCGAQVVAGFAERPIAESYEPGYAESVAMAPRRIEPRIDDMMGPFSTE